MDAGLKLPNERPPHFFLSLLTLCQSVSLLLPESSTHISQAGGKHVVRGRRRPHHHHGLARLTDPGWCSGSRCSRGSQHVGSVLCEPELCECLYTCCFVTFCYREYLLTPGMSPSSCSCSWALSVCRVSRLVCRWCRFFVLCSIFQHVEASDTYTRALHWSQALIWTVSTINDTIATVLAESVCPVKSGTPGATVALNKWKEA